MRGQMPGPRSPEQEGYGFTGILAITEVRDRPLSKATPEAAMLRSLPLPLGVMIIRSCRNGQSSIQKEHSLLRPALEIPACGALNFQIGLEQVEDPFEGSRQLLPRVDGEGEASGVGSIGVRILADDHNLHAPIGRQPIGQEDILYVGVPRPRRTRPEKAAQVAHVRLAELGNKTWPSIAGKVGL